MNLPEMLEAVAAYQKELALEQLVIRPKIVDYTFIHRGNDCEMWAVLDDDHRVMVIRWDDYEYHVGAWYEKHDRQTFLGLTVEKARELIQKHVRPRRYTSNGYY